MFRFQHSAFIKPGAWCFSPDHEIAEHCHPGGSWIESGRNPGSAAGCRIESGMTVWFCMIVDFIQNPISMTLCASLSHHVHQKVHDKPGGTGPAQKPGPSPHLSEGLPVVHESHDEFSESFPFKLTLKKHHSASTPGQKGGIGFLVVVGTFFPVDIRYYLAFWALSAAIIIPWSIYDIRKINNDTWEDVVIEGQTHA